MNTDDARAWVDRFIAAVRQRSDELTELDRQAGDGDFGTNLTSAVQRAETNLAAASPSAPHEVFLALANAFLHTGGTSGPLFGMWFREFAKRINGEVTTATLSIAADNAATAVRRLGNADVGHKTMVDAMVPAAEALSAAAARHDDVNAALKAAAAAAHAGAISTADLLAKRGRASYVGEHARGVIDPGALTIAWFFDLATTSAT
ncbi:MAG TPA: dihydroxyacetone kinase subunit DhaL [Pseudonocardiaceae bacterium]|nr:dihydroxyacetone kinase subunit DhaL [Pseudonocardiaceae bacterium]